MNVDDARRCLRNGDRIRIIGVSPGQSILLEQVVTFRGIAGRSIMIELHDGTPAWIEGWEPVVEVPTFTSTADADAWLDANAR